MRHDPDLPRDDPSKRLHRSRGGSPWAPYGSPPDWRDVHHLTSQGGDVPGPASGWRVFFSVPLSPLFARDMRRGISRSDLFTRTGGTRRCSSHLILGDPIVGG